MDGVSFLSEGAAAETDTGGDSDNNDMELVGMALMQPKPFTVKMRKIVHHRIPDAVARGRRFSLRRLSISNIIHHRPPPKNA